MWTNIPVTELIMRFSPAELMLLLLMMNPQPGSQSPQSGGDVARAYPPREEGCLRAWCQTTLPLLLYCCCCVCECMRAGDRTMELRWAFAPGGRPLSLPPKK